MDAASDMMAHHLVIGSPRAWELTRGAPSVVVATIDDGVDIDHPALSHSIWTNPGESGLDEAGRDRSSNGRDDDGNGYVDDVHGYDFTGAGDADPRPDWQWHGTHLAGIIAASHDAASQARGIAPGAQLLPIRFAKGSGPWSGFELARMLDYAVNAGARIISISQSNDEQAQDPAYLAAVARVYASGVLLVHSAGNANRNGTSRQKIDEILYVANTAIGAERDRRYHTSTYGYGVDLSAPGEIVSTMPHDSYDTNNGTSMSAPLVAGAAALVWSRFPDWSREQVAARLLASSDDIDALNPDYRGLLGAGRLNVARALEDDIRPPRLRGLDTDALEPGGQTLTLRLLDILSPASVAATDFALMRLDGGAAAARIPLKLVTAYRAFSNRLVFELGAPLAAGGRYRFEVPATLASPFGVALRAAAGGSLGYSEIFVVTPRDRTPPTLESLRLEQQTARAGDRLCFRVTARDDAAGLATMTLTFVSEAGYRWTAMATMAGDQRWDGRTCVSVPADAENGSYRLMTVSIADRQGREAILHRDGDSAAQQMLAPVAWTLIDGRIPDHDPPELSALTLPTTTPGGVTWRGSLRARDASSLSRIQIAFQEESTRRRLPVASLPLEASEGDLWEFSGSVGVDLPAGRYFPYFLAICDSRDQCREFTSYADYQVLKQTDIPLPRVQVSSGRE
jgi:hypothetical protein